VEVLHKLIVAVNRWSSSHQRDSLNGASSTD